MGLITKARKAKPAFAKATAGKGGGDRIRTGVQTYPSKAFYMLISLLFVGDEQETTKPIHHLAV